MNSVHHQQPIDLSTVAIYIYMYLITLYILAIKLFDDATAADDGVFTQICKKVRYAVIQLDDMTIYTCMVSNMW